MKLEGYDTAREQWREHPSRTRHAHPRGIYGVYSRQAPDRPLRRALRGSGPLTLPTATPRIF